MGCLKLNYNYNTDLKISSVNNYVRSNKSENNNRSNYLFGFNGQEKVNEIAGTGNHNTALFWEYDTRLGRRWNVDPVDQVSISNYSTFGNNPIENTDVLGDKKFHYERTKAEDGTTVMKLTNTETVYKTVLKGYVYNTNSNRMPSGRFPVYETVEDTKDQYVVHEKQNLPIPSHSKLKWQVYDCTGTYDSYSEAKNAPSSSLSPGLGYAFQVGLEAMADEHRMGNAPGAAGRRAFGSSVDFGSAQNRVSARIGGMRDRSSGSYKAYFFGSRNNGTSSTGSDLDLLILTENPSFFSSGRGASILNQIKADYKNSTGVELDVNIMTNKMYNSAKGGDFKKSVEANKTEIKVK